jgi:hypothetical protein
MIRLGVDGLVATPDSVKFSADLAPNSETFLSPTQPSQRTRIQIFIKCPPLPLLIISSPRRNRRASRMPRQLHPIKPNSFTRTRSTLNISNLMLLQISLCAMHTLHRPQRIPFNPFITTATRRLPPIMLQSTIIILESPCESRITPRPTVSRSQSDEFAQNREFHFQLDAVDDAFEKLAGRRGGLGIR